MAETRAGTKFADTRTKLVGEGQTGSASWRVRCDAILRPRGLSIAIDERPPAQATRQIREARCADDEAVITSKTAGTSVPVGGRMQPPIATMRQRQRAQDLADSGGPGQVPRARPPDRTTGLSGVPPGSRTGRIAMQGIAGGVRV